MSESKKTASSSPFLLPAAIAVTLVAGGIGYGIAKQNRGTAAAAIPATLNVPSSSATMATTPVGVIPSNVALTPKAIRDAVPPITGSTLSERDVQKRVAMTEKDEKNPDAWVNLGDSLMQLSRERADAHNVGPAENAYRYALQLSPDFADALTGMAWVTGNRHQFDESIAWAKKSIAAKPGISLPYGLMGDAQEEQGDYEGALTSYQKMLDLRPDLSSYSRGAHLLYLMGDTRKAIWLMDKAVKSGGPYGENTAWCRAQMAEMLWSMGALLPAETVVKSALEVTPKNPFVLTIAAKVRLSKNDLKGATEAAETAVATAPQHIAALVLLHDLYQKQKMTAKADAVSAEIEAAAAHYRTHGNADRLFLAKFYADHDMKIADAEALVNERTKDGTATITAPSDADTAAWVYYKAGKQENAARYMKMAMEVGSPDAMRLYHAGMIAAKSGKDQEARMLLYKAMSKNSMFDPIQSTIAANKLDELGAKPMGANPADITTKVPKSGSRSMNSLIRRLSVTLLFLIALLQVGSATWAHTVPRSHLDIRVEPGHVTATLDAPASGYAIDLPPVRFATATELAAQSTALAKLVLSRLTVTENNVVIPLPLQPVGTAEIVPGGLPSDATIRLHLAASFPTSETVKTLTVKGDLFPTDPEHKCVITVKDATGELRHEALLSRATPEITANLTDSGKQQSQLSVFVTFVKEGVHHIAIGPDHILFIVGLLLMGGGLGRLLKVVTAFTLAHSITLALAALNIVSLPSRFVEPTIAASIVFVGLRVLGTVRLFNESDPVPAREERIFYAFGFGLIHGFGFAGALADMELPRHAIAVSLVGFNIGVELGQACIILAVAPLLALLHRRYPIIGLWVVRAAAAFVIAAGAYWFGQRIAG